MTKRIKTNTISRRIQIIDRTATDPLLTEEHISRITFSPVVFIPFFFSGKSWLESCDTSRCAYCFTLTHIHHAACV